MADFLVPHVADDGFETFVVFEDGILAGVDEVGAKFAGLVDAETAGEEETFAFGEGTAGFRVG